jgi:hypothetical protein
MIEVGEPVTITIEIRQKWNINNQVQIICATRLPFVIWSQERIPSTILKTYDVSIILF